MKVLVVTNNYLDVHGGGSNASRAHINSISSIASNCTVLHPVRSMPIFGMLTENINMVGVRDTRSNVKKYLDLLAGRIHRYHKQFHNVLTEARPEIVIFDGSRCAKRNARLAKSAGCRVIVIHHNCELDYYNDESKARSSMFEKWLVDPILRWHVSRNEKISVELADINISLSGSDEEIIRKAHHVKPSVSPFITIGVFEYARKSEVISTQPRVIESPRLAITGNLSTVQTENNIRQFLTDIYIPLFQQSKKISLSIAGRDPSTKFIRDFNSRYGINIISNPTNILEIINVADIYVCPADSGGGIKLRVMDGFRSGLPVLAQGISRRGYESFESAGYMAAYNTRDEFLKKMNLLVSKLQTGEIVRDAVQEYFSSNCSFDSGVARMKVILTEAGSRKPCEKGKV